MKSRRTPPSEPFASRIARVRDELARHKVDGYLILDRMDQYWLTGFTGEDGGVLVTAREVLLLTDGRFDQTADIEAPFATKLVRKKRTPDVTAKEVRRRRIRRLGYDPGHLPVRDFVALKQELRGVRLVARSDLVAGLRECKDPGEIACIRKAIDVAERAFRELCGWLKPGMTEREVAARLIYDMNRMGASAPAFEPIVAVGATGSLPHYEPGDRVVNQREGVLIDWGARVDWYVSDLTRVVWPGSIPAQLATVYEVVREAEQAAIAAVKPGVKASTIDRVARTHITRAGFGKLFNHSVGHGIGLRVHEAPGMRKTSDACLKPGMVVTVEPGVYIPGVGGVRIEDDVLVTETGREVLSKLPSDLPSMRLSRAPGS